MAWSIEDVEDRLLNGKIGSIAMAPPAILEAINRAERMLGSDWIASTGSAKGLAPTMDIVGTGLRLGYLGGIAQSEKLTEGIRPRSRVQTRN